MTTNTYNKAKNNEQALANKEVHAQTVSRTRVNTGNAGTQTNTSRKTQNDAKAREAERRAAARRRARAHTQPEAVRTRLPAILGFDTRDKFITKTATAVNKYPIVLGIAVTVLLTLMFMCVVVNAVDVNKLKIETTNMSSELESLIEKDAELSLELEKRDQAEFIREFAKNQLGMIDKKNVTKYHISMDNEDKIVIVGNSASDPVVEAESD